MTIELENEDLRIFFNTDEFAVAASIQDRIVKGIQAKTYSTENQVYCCEVSLTCAEADLEGVELGDAVIMKGQSYEIIEIKRDGTGLATLTLTVNT